MTDRPIIFSTPMVRALLDGRKTQTRRLATSPLSKCVAGDRLWVRESCRAEQLSRPPYTRPTTEKERHETQRTSILVLDEQDGADGVLYAADNKWESIQNTRQAGEAWSALFYYRGCGARRLGNPVPSIHMPRWASRLTLHVEAVRVERLQDITEQDAIAEGAERLSMDDDGKFYQETGGSHRKGFAGLWSHLHGADSWDANPWIVALTFRVERANIDATGSNVREGEISAVECSDDT